MFPPVVSQLVIVGEQTGNLSKATGYVRDHLRKQIERQAEWLVGMLEPILTIGMAVAIGIILLAIYLPMFGMIDAVEGAKPPS
jgi:type IV pilus assembly protein PilC